MPSRSRILFAKNGRKKIFSIDRTLEKYGQLSAKELVDITHRENTPWKMTEVKLWPQKSIISDEKIKKFHKYEMI